MTSRKREGDATTLERLRADLRGRLADEQQLNREITVDLVENCARDVVVAYERRAETQSQILPLVDPVATTARLVDDVLAWGPLTRYLADPNVEEINVEADQIFVKDHTSGKFQQIVTQATEAELQQAVLRMLEGAGVALDRSTPCAKALVLGGTVRLAAQIPPVQSALSAVIRRFHAPVQNLRQLIQYGSLTSGAASFLWAVMKQPTSRVVVSGIPGAGKTTLLTAMHRVVPRHHVIRIIESTTEMTLDHPLASNTQEAGDWTLSRLIEFSLVMSPVRIVVGEVLGAEAAVLIRAANAGCGFACTVHSNSALDALFALADNATKAGPNQSYESATRAFARAIDYVVHLSADSRLGDKRRQVMEILAVDRTPQKSGRFHTRPIFARPRLGEPMTWTGQRPDEDAEALLNASIQGITIDEILKGKAVPAVLE